MIGSLFSGIGGLELGLERALGWPVAWQVEIDEWCRSVLAAHWPAAERFSDVSTVGSAVLRPVDLICGGFPCQDVSSAGRGAGLAGERSGLWFEYLRIVDELRPRIVVVENVASGARRWVDTVCDGLAALGYRPRPLALSAADVGAPHLRRRVFVVADTVGGDLRHEQGTSVCEAAARAGTLANGDSGGREGQRLCRLPDGQRPSLGDDTHRCGGAHAWPPRRGDADGWREWLGAGHPTPAVPVVRRGADGLPRGMDRRRLKSLGNAVVPQCAEVIGRYIAGEVL